jgi:TPR repeat protein
VRAILLSTTILAVACGAPRSARPADPIESRGVPAPAACIADELGPLDGGGPWRDCGEEEDACKRDCDAGDATACWALAAWRQQQGDEPASASLFERACRLGHSNACTNLAAAMWLAADAPAPYECARRVFELVCPLGDHFACGMDGRLRLHRHEGDDLTRGRALLERSCIALRGFPCRILALNLENGVLDGGSPEKIKSLMAEACAGGDTPACGDHESVDASFQSR